MQIIHNGIGLEVTNVKLQEEIMALVFGGLRGNMPKEVKKARVKKTHHRWTDEDKEILRSSLENKIPLKEIVKNLNYKFTLSAVNAMSYQTYPDLIKAMTGKPFGKHLHKNEFGNLVREVKHSMGF